MEWAELTRGGKQWAPGRAGRPAAGRDHAVLRLVVARRRLLVEPARELRARTPLGRLHSSLDPASVQSTEGEH